MNFGEIYTTVDYKNKKKKKKKKKGYADSFASTAYVIILDIYTSVKTLPFLVAWAERVGSPVEI